MSPPSLPSPTGHTSPHTVTHTMRPSQSLAMNAADAREGVEGQGTGEKPRGRMEERSQEGVEREPSPEGKDADTASTSRLWSSL